MCVLNELWTRCVSASDISIPSVPFSHLHSTSTLRVHMQEVLQIQAVVCVIACLRYIYCIACIHVDSLIHVSLDGVSCRCIHVLPRNACQMMQRQHQSATRTTGPFKQHAWLLDQPNTRALSDSVPACCLLRHVVTELLWLVLKLHSIPG
jgi:hypothetical protein